MKSLNFRLLLTLFLPILLASCNGAGMFQPTPCDPNTFYAAGVNDAQGGREMKTYLPEAANCSENRSLLITAYQQGYVSGLKGHSSTVININTESGSSDEWGCLETPFKQVCGYGCIKDDRFNEVYCGARSGDNCVENQFGKIKCGRHCRVDSFNNITCDKERYSKDSKR